METWDSCGIQTDLIVHSDVSTRIYHRNKAIMLKKSSIKKHILFYSLGRKCKGTQYFVRILKTPGIQSKEVVQYAC